MTTKSKPIGEHEHSLSDFSRRKASLLEYIASLQEIANELKCDASADFLRILEERLSSERFNVVVLGGFKRGKSTLINAMIGSRVLPTGVVPLTSVITKLCHGPKTEAEIIFNDGSRLMVDSRALDQYVTEKGNPGNKKNVSEVNLLVPSDLLRDGVVVVDTPGVGSSYERNTAVTAGFLAHVDAALFVFGVDPPISQMELEFLSDIADNSSALFLIQNKMDMISRRESEEVLDFSRSVLVESLKNPDLKIFPISAKLALEGREEGDGDKLRQSGYMELEKNILEFLATSKGEAVIVSARKRLVRLVSDFSTVVGIERKILCDPIVEMNEKVAWLEEEIRTARRKLEEMDSLIDVRISHVVSVFAQKLEETKNRVKSTLASDLESLLKKMPTNISKRQYLETVQRFIADRIEESYRPFVKSANDEISKQLTTVLADFLAEANRSSESMMKRIAEMFGVPVRRPEIPDVVVDESRFRFETVSVLKCESIVPAELPMILPNRSYRKTIAKKANEVMLREIEQHAGKIRYDIDYRLSESARRAKSEVRNRMLLSIESMERALNAGKESIHGAGQLRDLRLTSLKKIEGRLKAIEADLDRY